MTLLLRVIDVGDICSTPSGKRGMLLGYVSTEIMSVTLPENTEKYFWNQRDQEILKKGNVNFSVSFRRKDFASLWLLLHDPHRKVFFNAPDMLAEDFLYSSIKNKKIYRFVVTQNFNYNKKNPIGTAKVSKEIIINVRKMANESGLLSIARHRSSRTNYPLSSTISRESLNPSDRLRHYDASLIRERQAPLANMVPFGMDPIRSEVCNLFNPWVTENKQTKRR